MEQKEKEEYLKKALKRFERAQKADKDEREVALEDLKFKNGDQWESSVRKDRDDAHRPCLTTNRLPGFTDLVTGQMKMNQVSIKVRPVDGEGDVETADIFGGLIRNIESVSNAEEIYDAVADSIVDCGRGFFRVLTKYTDDDSFEQDIVIESIPNQFSVVWEPGSKKSDLSDSNYFFISDQITRDEFEEKYPNSNPIEFPADKDVEYANDWATEDNVRVAEYWTKVPIKKKIYQLADGIVVDDETKASVENPIINIREADSFKIEWCLMSGNDILEGPQEWAGKYIPIIPVWGKVTNIGNKRTTRGIIRFAKDPQRIYNYWRTAGTEFVGMTPKVPYLLTATQIKGHEPAWNVSHIELKPYLLFNPDPQNPGRPQREQPPQMSSGISEQLEFCVDELKATTGIYEASLGQRSNETSGIAIERRQNQGNISTYHFNKNLASSVSYCGRVLIDLIKKIYDTDRMVRIIGADGAEKFIAINTYTDPETGEKSDSIFNDLSVGKYDIVVTTGPGYLTQREEAAEQMMKLMEVYPEITPIIADRVVANLDFPGADEISDRLKKIVPKGIIDEDDEDMQDKEIPEEQQPDPMQELEMKKAVAEINNLELEGIKTIAETRKIEAEIE